MPRNWDKWYSPENQEREKVMKWEQAYTLYCRLYQVNEDQAVFMGLHANPKKVHKDKRFGIYKMIEAKGYDWCGVNVGWSNLPCVYRDGLGKPK